jgi:aryl-alcohol dehydrogenase-like predicted oxidoreductase
MRVTADAAGTWRLGDLTVNRLGFGAKQLTGDPAGDGPPSDRRQAIAVLRRAVELGVNHIDTASFYFSPLRSANELINTALAPYQDDVVIATKVGPSRDGLGTWLGMGRPEQLRGQVEENLRQLGRDHLDLVNLRTLSVSKPVGEHFAALAELREVGLIRHLGLSNVTVAQIDEALAIAPVVAVQNRYSIDSRRLEADDVLAACAERGIAFVPFYAIAGQGKDDGRPAGGPAAGDPEPVPAIARRRGATPAQVRLAWALARGRHVLAIPGTRKRAHLEENVAAGALRLTDADLAELAEVSPAALRSRPPDRSGGYEFTW